MLFANPRCSSSSVIHVFVCPSLKLIISYFFSNFYIIFLIQNKPFILSGTLFYWLKYKDFFSIKKCVICNFTKYIYFFDLTVSIGHLVLLSIGQNIFVCCVFQEGYVKKNLIAQNFSITTVLFTAGTVLN